MKKILFLFMIFPTMAFAQFCGGPFGQGCTGSGGGSAGWTLFGSNTTTTNNVGIGSTNPGQALDVNGTVRALGYNMVGSGNSSFSGNVGIGTTLSTNALDVATGGVSIGTAYAGHQTAPTNGLVVQGNVGIGTNGNSGTLEVRGSIVNSRGTGLVDIQNTIQSPTTPVYAFYNDTNTGMGQSGTHDLTFATNNVQRVRIDSSGNIGIGTNLSNGLLSIGGGCATHAGQPACIAATATGASLGYCNGGLSAACGTCTAC